MRMRCSLFALLTSILLLANGQERCGTFTPDSEAFEKWMKAKISKKNVRFQAHKAKATLYEIPIVVHVIEPSSGGNLNISDELIIRQIEILNEDFRRTNADTSNTPAAFLPVAADTEIQFILAKQDPSGNPSNGIVRTLGFKDKYSATIHQKLLRSESYWPPENYLNLYVLDILNFLGYASFPISNLPGIDNASEDYLWDGILIDYQYFGENSNTPSFDSFGRTAAHEIGHYLGLHHIWGGGGGVVSMIL